MCSGVICFDAKTAADYAISKFITVKCAADVATTLRPTWLRYARLVIALNTMDEFAEQKHRQVCW
jgi:hypothetical protein